MTLPAPASSGSTTAAALSAREREDVNSRMRHLSARLNQHAALVQGSAVLLDYPVHGNVGDLLIWKGEQAFLKRNKKKLAAQYSIKNIGRGAMRRIAQCDTICLHGGGNFGDLWPIHQRLRENLIARYEDKRIIIFPQSVFYADPKELDRACHHLKRHPDLHILLRDEISLQLLEQRGVPNLRLCPDMAHALWGRWCSRSPTTDNAERLFVLRRDKERGALPEWLAGMEASSTDWGDLRQGRAETWFRNGIKIINMDKKCGNALPACTVWNLVADVLIGRAIKLIAAHDTVVTNRLHAVIGSALVGRHVVAYDNSYGKVSAYMDCWLSGLDEIQIQ